MCPQRDNCFYGDIYPEMVSPRERPTDESLFVIPNPFEIHHYIGGWYFNLKYLRWRSARQLIWYSVTHLIASQRKVRRPWLMFISLVT
jgi:hypothetical protein